MILTKERKNKEQEKAYSSISVRSFVTVAVLLLVVLFFCGSLSYFIPQGAFERDAESNIIPGTYQAGDVKGIALWRVITAPVRVFASEDALTIIMISVFLLIMSGVFKRPALASAKPYAIRQPKDDGSDLADCDAWIKAAETLPKA